jgi:hypothetical protein
MALEDVKDWWKRVFGVTTSVEALEELDCH